MTKAERTGYDDAQAFSPRQYKLFNGAARLIRMCDAAERVEYDRGYTAGRAAIPAWKLRKFYDGGCV